MSPANEHLFDAFRYVAGELPDDEREQFEQRLAGDQECRDALAQAIRLSQAVCTAEDAPQALPQPAPRRRVSRKARWVAVLAAACVVAAVGVGLSLNSGRDADSPQLAEEGDSPSQVVERRTRAKVDRHAGRLVELWVDAGPSENATESDAGLSSLADWYSQAIDSSAEADSEETLTVPDWMIAAVAPEETESMPGVPQPEDRIEEN